MSRRIYYLLILIVMLVELAQLSETYKLLKIRKLSRPKPWGHGRPPWRTVSHRPKYHRRRYPKRHPPNYTTDDQSYTIEIELPKNGRENTWQSHHRPWSNRKTYKSPSQFIDDNADRQWKSQKKLRIKILKDIKPSLRIKVSRNDVISDKLHPINLVQPPSRDLDGG